MATSYAPGVGRKVNRLTVRRAYDEKAKTYGVKLNPRDPDDKLLMDRLSGSRNVSDAIRQALLADARGRSTESVATSQQVAELHAELAWLKQNADRKVKANPRSGEILDELSGLLDQLEASIDQLIGE